MPSLFGRCTFFVSRTPLRTRVTSRSRESALSVAEGNLSPFSGSHAVWRGRSAATWEFQTGNEVLIGTPSCGGQTI